MTQADSLGPKVSDHWRCFCIHRVNRVNTHRALTTMLAPYDINIVQLILL